MGVTVAACVAIGLFLGVAADARFHTGPVFTFVGLGAGLALGVLSVWAEVRRFLS